jgi:molybdate transport repressor ModE-like protein
MDLAMSRATSRHRKPASLVPRVKVWLETIGRRYAFGMGLAEILQSVDQAGSMKQGAANLGKSYRYVWGRIKDGEQALGLQLVETQVGGQGSQRSSLTPEARLLVDNFLALRGRMIEVLQQEYAGRFDRTSTTPP